MSGPTIGTIRGTIVIDYDGKGIIKAQDDVDGLGKRSEKTALNLDKTARNLAIFGGVVAGGFAVAAGAAISFEKRMSAIEAVSGATAAQMDLLSKKALQLGADTKFSASEAGLAMEELVKAGLSVEDVLNGAADATVNLAAAGEVDLPFAASIAANALNQFNLKASDLNKVVDNIAGAANASAIDVKEFGFSLSQVGAVAHLAGQSFEDTATAIALMGNAGIKGSDAGTSLKTFLNNLIPTTERQIKVFKELGLAVGASGNAFIDAKGNYKSLGEIAGVLHTATAGLSESQKTLALDTLFGSDAIRAAAVISNAGAEGFANLNAEMNKTTAAEVAKTRMDNTAGSIEQLKGSVETLGIQIGTVLLPAINNIVDVISDVVTWFSNLDKGVQNTILIVIGVAGAIALLVAAIIKIIEFTKAFMIVWRLLNISFLFSPIGLIIALIVVLIGVIILIATKTTWFQQLWEIVWGAIKKAAMAVADWFMNTIVPSLQKAWEQLWAIIKFVIDLIIGYFKFWQMVLTAIFNFVIDYIKMWIAIFKAIFEGIKTILDRVGTFFSNLKDQIVTRLTDAIAFVKSIPGRIMDALGNLGSLLYDSGRKLIQGLIDGIASMVSRLMSTAKNLLSGLRNLFPFSPAKEGPFSGRGWTGYSGEALIRDFAKGMDRASSISFDTALGALEGVAMSLNPTTSTPGATATTTTNVGGSTNIGSVNVTGVWDFTDPVAARKMVGQLDLQLSNYRKGYN
jgi:TP901 family phage tail tape measure protein